MPDSFEWPDQDTLRDDASFRMWLIQTLQRIHDRVSETTRLQKVANGRVDKLEKAIEPLPTIQLRVTLVERIVFGAAGIVLTGFFAGLILLVWKTR